MQNYQKYINKQSKNNLPVVRILPMSILPTQNFQLLAFV